VESKKLLVGDFLNQHEIVNVRTRAKIFRESGTQVSDIIDADKNQYVDLVQEGGGVLGIALVGYTWAMEEAGIRFFSLAGTSAGAINTIFLASMGDISQPKALMILEELCQKDLFEFVDGKRPVKRIINSAVNSRIVWSVVQTFLHLFRVIKIIKKNQGLNPGNAFYEWIEKILEKNGAGTTDQLKELRSKLPAGLISRNNEDIDDLLPKLVLIASEITSQTKVHFPEMAELYFKDPGRVNPADYVRASMSIPVFFEPYTVNDIPDDAATKALWKTKVKFDGDPPKSVVFVDGGTISNFPINVFHNPFRIPRLPTFGVRLSAYREMLNKTDKLSSYFGAILNTMRHIYDFDFLLQNPDYSQLICRLDTDNEFNWLDFNLSDDMKLKLFKKGALGAINFLEQFNWEGYKKLRASLLLQTKTNP
jgi:NTE family protein